MKKIAFIAVAGVLALSACANSFEGSTQDTTHAGEINKIVINYKGKPLTCVILNQQTNYQTMSCDFIDYYNNDNSLEGQPSK
jgi:hypothetical protein